MHSQRSRKRQEIRTVALSRGRTGFGFTITGELPCRLGGVVPGSAADSAGLQSGDRLIGINGQDVSMLSHDEVVRRIGSCRNVLRLNVAEHSSEESSADSSDNAEMYVGRVVNNGLRPRPIPVGSAQQQPMETVGLEVGQSGFVNRHKYARHIHSGHAERRRHTHIMGSSGSDRHTGMKGSHDHLDMHHCNESPSGMMRRRRTKHTVITREARMGIRSPERRPQHGDRCSHNACDDSDDDDISLSSSELQVVVAYSGSVEMPSDAPRLAGSRLQSICGAVSRLRATNRARSLVVMDISADGVRLTDAMCRVVACYVTSRIAFCGICPDDRRFFGIVMSSGGESANSSCHVFMVDPEIAEHHLHAGIAARFGLNCTMDLDTPRCLEFPLSAVPIIRFLGRLYRHRKNSASFVPLSGNFCNTNSRGICEGKLTDDRVYVVDVLKDNNGQRSCADGSAEDENELFIHNLSIIEPVLADDGNLLDHNGPLQSRKFDEQKCLGRGRLITRSLSQASSILRESNHHIQSNGLRRVTTTLDENSFRQMPQYVMRSQPLRHCATDDDSDAESGSSVQESQHSGSTSPMPPPLPPKVFSSKYNPNMRLAASKPSQSSALGVPSGVGSTPVRRTPRGSRRSVPVPQSCSASKPPLPERRPTSIRSVHKSTGSLKPDIPDRPKSTPPVNKMSLAPPVETVDYDSDPVERLNEETGKQQCVTRQSDDNAVINSPEDLCLEEVRFLYQCNIDAVRLACWCSCLFFSQLALF